MSTVCLAYCSPGEVATTFHESISMLKDRDPRIVGHVSMVSGPRISGARNDMVRMFLSHPKKPEWLLMLDADMIFPDDLVDQLLEASNPKVRPVVGGLCFGGGRVGIPFPTLYTLTDPKTNNGRMTKVVLDYPRDALCKVDATGAACLFMHRDVLLQMAEQYGKTPDGYSNPHPWFSETVHQGFEYGEDWTFCMRLKQMGIPLYVHTGIRLGHDKRHVYDEEFYHAMRRAFPDKYKGVSS